MPYRWVTEASDRAQDPDSPGRGLRGKCADGKRCGESENLPGRPPRRARDARAARRGRRRKPVPPPAPLQGNAGVSPRDYQDAHRVEAVKSSLKNGSRVTDALYEAGYGSVSRFYEKPRLGMSARDYRAKGKGQRIAFSTFKTSLGTVLIAATEKGLCSVKLGDDRRAATPARGGVQPSRNSRDRLPENEQRSSRSSAAKEASPGCRSTSAARCSSAACGTSCAAFRAARRAPTATSRAPSARLPRCARSAARAARTRWRSSCRATARCAPTAASAVTPGAFQEEAPPRARESQAENQSDLSWNFTTRGRLLRPALAVEHRAWNRWPRGPGLSSRAGSSMRPSAHLAKKPCG